jgi:glycerophosphoryl diester phosphodiesterase
LTQVLAHRGASSSRRENTVEAFLEARALGSDGVELDVRLSADGALVVHHDLEIGGLGPISELGVRHLPPWVPLLGEALDACSGMVVDVEVKNLASEPGWDPHETAASLVAAQLAEVSATLAGTIVSSFSPATLEAVRSADAALSTGWLTVGGEPGSLVELASSLGCSAVHPLHSTVTAELVGACHEAGLAVRAWTVDDPDRIVELGALGVDAVITNRPEVALAVLR